MTALYSSGVLLLAQDRDNLGPSLRPAIIAGHIPQRHHGVDVVWSPMHATAFQARFDHQFVGTFDRPVTNRPASLLELGILHQSYALLQIGQFLLQFR